MWIEEVYVPTPSRNIRSVKSWLVVVSLIAALLAFGALPAHAAAPTIQGQNPSTGGPGTIISDKDSTTDSNYHFVARVSDAGGLGGHIAGVTVSVDDGDGDSTVDVSLAMTRVGTTDAWQVLWPMDVTGTADNGGGRATFTVVDVDGATASDGFAVTIARQTETVEIASPANGGNVEFFDYDSNGTLEASITGTVSSGLIADPDDRVDLFLSTSSATTDPVWVDCGDGDIKADGTFEGKCGLPAGTSASAVTMIAARAVEDLECTPPTVPPQSECVVVPPALTVPRLHSGDAHRVTGTVANFILDVTPEDKENDVGSSHTMTATLTDDGQPVSGAVVNFEYAGANDRDDAFSTATPDDRCTTKETGSCTVVIGPTSNQGDESPPVTETTTESGTTTITAWSGSALDAGESPGDNDSDTTDVVLKRWRAGVARSLDCGPETAVNPTTGPDSAETYTCAVQDQFGNGVSGTAVDAENLDGANDPDNDADGGPASTPDYTCSTTTGPNGTCTVTVAPSTPAEAGVAEICFWADTDNDAIYNANATGTQEEDGDLCNEETATATEKNNLTDIVRKEWVPASPTVQAQNPSVGGPGTFISDKDSTTDSTYHFIARVSDPNGLDDITGVTVEVDDGDGDSSADIALPMTRVGTTDAWEVFWTMDVTGTADAGAGRVTFTARDTEGASGIDTLAVQISRVTETVEIANPANGGTLKFFDYDGNGTTEASITGTVSSGLDPTDDRLDLFFSTSGATTDPTWVDCGDGDIKSDHTFEGKCGPLPAGTSLASITMVAARPVEVLSCVPPTAPECQVIPPPGATANRFHSGDAHRVSATAANFVLDVEPENATNNVGTSHTLTATLTDDGQPVTGAVVRFEYAGANDPDDSFSTASADDRCTTKADGTCRVVIGPSASNQGDESPPVTETTSEPGTTTITAWAGTSPDSGESPVTADSDTTDVVLKTWVAAEAGPEGTLDCDPENAENPSEGPGSSELYTCSLEDEFGNAVSGTPIDAENLNGANDSDNNATGGPASTADYNNICTTGSGGTCTATVTPTMGEEGTAEICFWADLDNDAIFNSGGSEQDGGLCNEEEPGDPEADNLTDIVVKEWSAAVASFLDVEPETDFNPTGTTHSVTASATDQFDRPVSGTLVDFEFSGSNDPDDANSPASPDAFCTTGSGGTCSVQFFGSEPETTSIRGWIDEDGNHGGSPNHGAVEADLGEGRDEDSDPGDNDEPDATDVAEKTWTSTATAGEVSLDCEPETDTNFAGDSHQVTCTVRDGSSPVSGAVIDGENLNGANDPDNASGGASPDYDPFCTTGPSGTCVGTVTAPGFEVGSADLCFWVDEDEDSQVDIPGTTGTARPEDGDACNEEAPSADADGNSTDIVQKTWVEEDEQPPPPGEPGTEQYIPEGSTHPGFNTFVLIANPNDFDVTVDVTFLTDTGPVKPGAVQDLTLGPFTRRTIPVNTFLPASKDVATKIISSAPVVAEGSMHAGGIRASSDMVASPVTASEWFQPEGATHSGFGTFILIANPTEDTASTVKLTFFSGGGEIPGPTLVVPAGSRRTVSVGAECGCSADVSTFTEVLGAGPGVVVGMAIHKRGSSGDLGIGGSLATRSTANTWTIPEGATHSGWTSFILIANPNDTASTVAVTLLRSAGPQAIPNVTVPARSRFTISLNIACGLCSDDVGAILEVVSGGPVSVEGTIQKEDLSGFVIGDSVGSPGADLEGTLGTRWYNAEGATHSGFTTFLLLANPTSSSASVDVTFIRSDGTNIAGRTVVLPPFSRDTLDAWVECINADTIDDSLCRTDVWAFVGSDSDGFVMELAIDAGGPGAGFSKGRSLSSKAQGFPPPSNGE